MMVTLTIQQYPKRYIYFALLSMAIFRLPLYFNKKISFYKLMGSGKNGSFDIHPDWQQWAILTVHKENIDPTIADNEIPATILGTFISRWFNFFKIKTSHVFLEPIEGHGTWDGKLPFGALEKNTPYDGEIAILTRATIRLSKLKAFWKNVDSVGAKTNGAQGLIKSIGIGEVPFIKQATFSVWENKAAMKQFAYAMKEHTDVIVKTRKENWYSEEMFTRFKVIKKINWP